jgi:CheY-like chemotaxis protein
MLFLANISHELRTPLNGVLGMLRLLEKMKLKKEEKYFLKMAVYSADQLYGIISDILDFNDIEHGRMKAEKVFFDPDAALRNIIELVKPSGEEKNIETKYSGCDDILILSCEVCFTQICMNLLSNAYKFSQTGTVEIVTAYSGGSFSVFIKDEGPGISPEKLPDIFRDFVQLEDPYSKKHRGTGLGLAISKRLAELAGGRISVESEPGRGSVFTLILPAESCRKTRDTDNENPVNIKEPGKNKHKVLAVEDERINLMYLKQLIMDNGYEVIEAVNAYEALEKIRLFKPDIVLMDIGLPGLSGTDAVKELRTGEEFKDLPVIALTAHSGEENRKSFMEAGLTDVVIKPFKEENLLKIIKKYLNLIF